MLHYSVDNELMSDLYRDYRQMKGAEYAQLHELGEHYLSLIEGYDIIVISMNRPNKDSCSSLNAISACLIFR